MSDEIYYVYAKLRPDGVPCYVGKAEKKNRPRVHDRFNTHHANKYLAAVYKEAGVKELPTQIVLENLTHAAAQRVEIQLIQKIGRIDLGTGSLCNMTEGGEDTYTPEGRRRLSDMRRGKKLSAETCVRVRDGVKAGWTDPATRARMTAHWADPKNRAKIGAAFRGKKLSPETKAKIAAAATARWASPEFRIKAG
jgi:hypothetical protein